MKENKWLVALKGLIVGATMIVPGASGGTMAIILGIYDQLISAVSSFRENIKVNFLFLATFALGAGAGLFFFSAPMSWLLENYEVPVICFFVVVILCGVPAVGKKSGVEKVTPAVAAYMAFGAVLVAGISKIPENIFQTESFLGLSAAGFFASVALILPGISFSHFLLILGIYEQLLSAVKTLRPGFLIPLGLGVFTGVVLLSRLLEKLMEKYPKQTYMMILGFILGSLAELIAGL